ncbi:manganese efflux pump MntP family protein [Caviibacterium pharyngocola]|uniref:Putative manganese efflux pump MntP n=1 Tax=Caviibacterium pharyngocola TaxID=28159 RepID=A0A2M8RYF4_9PAST|nr:manganese efflux pump MntP family protein [Caviibacterium pharyngocola]PJG83921.1 hypothetical protein CVP04_02180 [Caviibacterium pharyngocola]
MSVYALWAIAFGLSMDAFAVSICKGLACSSFQWRNALKTGVYFGAFQAGMPLLGFLLGVQFSETIKEVDHWLSFGLLSLIGVNMLKEALSKKDEPCAGTDFSAKSLFALGLATSIDALAVGVSFAFLSVDIWSAVAIIGLITMAMCIVGVKSGHLLGAKLKSKAELLGGLILIGIAISILIEHHAFG